MKELVINLRNHDGVHNSVNINGSEVGMLLGINITNHLILMKHIEATENKAHQGLYFLSLLHVPNDVYQPLKIHCAPSGCICSAQEPKKVQRVVELWAKT